MDREELMKARLTEVGKKQGMIDDTDGSASIEYISGFVDGWKEADEHPNPLWSRVKDEKPKTNELMLVQSSDDIFLAEADYRQKHWRTHENGESRFVYDYDLYIPISKLMEGGGQ